MIGIHGPSGIGKTTIARALFNQLSSSFKLKCFMRNLKQTYGSDGVYDYKSKLSLQRRLLSKILAQKDIMVDHLGAIEGSLQRQRVLIFLDDVDDVEQLDVLAKEPFWFGSGSRIILTTEDRKILKAHWANDIYHVGYPSNEEGLEILCMHAFKQPFPMNGFEDLALKIANLCGNLLLALCVVGSSLRGENKHEWECQLTKLEGSLHREIEDKLKVGYNKLSRNDQSLFLHIAFFFNNEASDYIATMLTDSNIDFINGLKSLAKKSVVHKSSNGWITVHCLLLKMARQVVYGQSYQPGKRQFLVDAEEIRDVLVNETVLHMDMNDY